MSAGSGYTDGEKAVTLYPEDLSAARNLFRRWLHCLIRRHHPIMETAGMEDTESWRVTWLGCSCGRTFDGKRRPKTKD